MQNELKIKEIIERTISEFESIDNLENQIQMVQSWVSEIQNSKSQDVVR